MIQALEKTFEKAAVLFFIRKDLHRKVRRDRISLTARGYDVSVGGDRVTFGRERTGDDVPQIGGVSRGLKGLLVTVQIQ
jgi:hypothetical protein